MVPASDSLPTDLAAAHAMIIAQRDALMAAEARASAAESEAQYRALLIEKLKYTIRKLRHERFGQSSERGALLEQLELQLADFFKGLRGIEWVIFELKAREKRGLQGDSAFREMGYLA